jgi:predicted Fe-Mo cluster-binding NifX family protein
VDQEFENTEAFLLYENDGRRTCFIGRQVCPRLADGGESLRRARLLADCDLVLCSNISDICRQKLSELGIYCNLAYAGATVSEAVSALQQAAGS